MGLFRGAVLVAATLAMGLISGLFYAYACSVLPGLHQTDDRTFVGAMQRINVAIINGWFLTTFLGAFVLTVVAAMLHIRQDGQGAFPWIASALLLYGATLAVTFVVNVPLNNRLAAAGRPDGVGDLRHVRERFETRWVRWNTARAVTSTAAFGCLIGALAQ